jgi:hypothetical protein
LEKNTGWGWNQKSVELIQIVSDDKLPQQGIILASQKISGHSQDMTLGVARIVIANCCLFQDESRTQGYLLRHDVIGSNRNDKEQHHYLNHFRYDVLMQKKHSEPAPFDIG